MRTNFKQTNNPAERSVSLGGVLVARMSGCGLFGLARGNELSRFLQRQPFGNDDVVAVAVGLARPDRSLGRLVEQLDLCVRRLNRPCCCCRSCSCSRHRLVLSLSCFRIKKHTTAKSLVPLCRFTSFPSVQQVIKVQTVILAQCLDIID